MFPPMGGASRYHSPVAILLGRIIDYNKHCQVPFGSYVQAVHENLPTNTQNPRTIGCIYLRPRLGDHVVHELLSLNSGKIITRRKVTVIPITDEVIARVEHFAKRDGMKPDLVFKNGRGEPILDLDLIAGADHALENNPVDYETDDMKPLTKITKTKMIITTLRMKSWMMKKSPKKKYNN